MDQFDFIVVGGGSAGCVLAERLSADRRNRVLLLEAGGHDRRLWIKLPIGYGKSFYDPAVNWQYRAEPDPGLGGRAAYWPRGKVLGGSGSINAMVYCRGMPGDFDDWRDAGNPGWGWSDVEPAFGRVERRIGKDGRVQGSGPLWVSDREPEYHPLKRHFLAAAREAGLPVTDDLNGAQPEGAASYPITTRHGLRWSAADAFLRPALRRPNLSVRTSSLAERILFDGPRAVGVQYRALGRPTQVRATRAVVLAAGAVNTPQLLQLSGIGPAAVLQQAGIDVRFGNDAVGGNLSDHLGINYFYRATEPTLNQVLGTWPGRAAAALQFLLTRSGPLSLSVNQMGGMVRTGAGQPRPNAQLYFNALSYTTETVGKRALLKPDPYPGFILSFNPCRPTSRGRIDIAGPDPAAPPRIVPNYLSTDSDIADVIACARLIGRLQNTAAMRALIADTPVFDPAAASDADILADFRARSGTVYHPCGTARMAPRDTGGVVDARLRVYGVEGLRVADASIFPNITSANTNAPTIMAAGKAAELMLQD